MKSLQRFKLVLTLCGPILVKSTSPSSFGVDAAVARDFITRKPCLPGTLVKGKIREALLQLEQSPVISRILDDWDMIQASTPSLKAFGNLAPIGSITELLPIRTALSKLSMSDDLERKRKSVLDGLVQLERIIHRIDNLFGKDTDPDSGNEPGRGSILIHDFISETPEQQKRRISRVSIDHNTGAARDQMLRTIETPYRAGQEVVFEGSATCYAEASELNTIRTTLLLGLRWLTQVGAMRTTGFGRILDATVEIDTEWDSKLEKPRVFETAPVALKATLHPQGPLCISRHKIGGNLFESDDIVPGNMLAGAIMETAKAMGVLIQKDCFDKIRFRSAFPSTGRTRPKILPLSTVKAGRLAYDIASFRAPVLLMDEKGGFSAPAFPIDWKEFGDVMKMHDWASPVRELRVRTAIDSQRRTADRGEDEEGGKLFAWEMIHPRTENKETIFWHTRIDLNDVPEHDRLETANALSRVLSQLGFVSKTKALCRCQIEPIDLPETGPNLTEGQSLSLVLESPALLADPRFQTVSGVAKSGALQAGEMHALYKEVWRELSDESLELSHFFAQQHLAGGNHLGNRFKKKDKLYNPWLLTDAGSVFVFKVANAAKVREKIKDWLSIGLPLPKWVQEPYGCGWRENPYIPQNGFGEIAVHEPIFGIPKNQSIPLVETVLPEPILP